MALSHPTEVYGDVFRGMDHHSSNDRRLHEESTERINDIANMPVFLHIA